VTWLILKERYLKHVPSLLQRLWSFLTQDAGWSVDHCCPTSRIMQQGLICKCRSSVMLSAQQWTPALHYSVFCMVQFIYLPVLHILIFLSSFPRFFQSVMNSTLFFSNCLLCFKGTVSSEYKENSHRSLQMS
jgi:hypothetical protein